MGREEVRWNFLSYYLRWSGLWSLQIGMGREEVRWGSLSYYLRWSDLWSLEEVRWASLRILQICQKQLELLIRNITTCDYKEFTY